MGLINDTLQTDIHQILNKENPNKAISLYATLHTPENDVKIRFLEAVTYFRDYNSSVGDYIMVEFRVTMDIYKGYIEPYRDNMEISIYGYFKDQYTGQIDGDEWPYGDRYKLVLLNQKNTQGDKLDSLSASDMSMAGLKVIQAQCVPRELELIRTVTTDGIINNSTIEDYLTWLYTISDGSYGSVSGENINYTPSVYPPNNTESISSVFIPTGTKVLDIPTYLQQVSVGMYKGDVGTYYQKIYANGALGNKSEDQNVIFVYPLYNKDMFDETQSPKAKLMIIYPANHLWDSASNNYIVDGETVKILPSGAIQMEDDGENEITNTGAGYITSNPMAVMSRNLDVSESEVTAEPTDSLNAVHVQDKRDGLVYTPVVPNVANEYLLLSELSKKMMCSYIVKWKFCDMNIIYPGMPVNIVRSTTRDGIIEIKGSVQATYCRWNQSDKTFVGVINIFAEKWSLNHELTAGFDDTADSSTNSLLGTEQLVNHT